MPPISIPAYDVIEIYFLKKSLLCPISCNQWPISNSVKLGEVIHYRSTLNAKLRFSLVTLIGWIFLYLTQTATKLTNFSFLTWLYKEYSIWHGSSTFEYYLNYICACEINIFKPLTKWFIGSLINNVRNQMKWDKIKCRSVNFLHLWAQ